MLTFQKVSVKLLHDVDYVLLGTPRSSSWTTVRACNLPEGLEYKAVGQHITQTLSGPV